VEAGQELRVSVDVTNSAGRDGEEVVQVYLSWPSAKAAAPLRKLVEFQRTFLAAGQTRRVSFVIQDRLMSLVNEEGERALEPGRLRLSVGGRQPDRRSEELAGTAVLSAEFEVAGSRRVFPD